MEPKYYLGGACGSGGQVIDAFFPYDTAEAAMDMGYSEVWICQNNILSLAYVMGYDTDLNRIWKACEPNATA